MKLFAILPLLTIVALSSASYGLAEGNNFCQGCRRIVSFVSRLNETRVDFADALKHHCDTFANPDEKLGCSYMVSKFFRLLDRVNPDYHCDEIGACGKADLSTVPQSANVSDNVFCGICVDSLNSFKAALTDPKVVDSFRANIQSVCSALKPMDADKECKDLLNDYLDQFLKFVQSLDAKKYCASIQLCGAKQSLAEPTLVELMGLGRVQEVIVGKKVTTDTKPPAYECVLCKRVVSQVEKMLANNRTEDQIKVALDKVCSIIYKNKDKRQQCDDMVNKYADEFLHILADESDPELVCMLMNLCRFEKKSESHEVDFNQLLGQLEEVFAQPSDVCYECKSFVHFIETHLANAASVEEFQRIMRTKLCDRLSGQELFKTCYTFVDKYGPILYDAMLRELDPDQVCTQLKACTAPEPAIVESQKYCETCMQVVTEIDEYLASNAIQKDITHLVEMVCEKFPEENRRECKLIVETFGPEIIKKIATMTNPKQVCGEIKLCEVSGHVKMLGLAKCSFGPGYWCFTEDNARACGAHDFCRRKVWKPINN